MNAVTSWFRGHRTLASVVTVALVAGVPLTFAALNPGYPVTDVQLSARDVWVTKSSGALAGRLNTQVGQLDATVRTLTNKFDVLQDGETILLWDKDASVLRQVDSSTTLTSGALTTHIPFGASASLDGHVLAIESPKGKLWRVPVTDDSNLNFDQASPSVHVPPLGAGSQISVERDGTVDAATRTGKLYQLDATTGAVRTLTIPRLSGSFQLSSVGTVPVILDLNKHVLIEGDGSTHPATNAVSLQQPGDASPYALMQSNSGLIRLNLATGLAQPVPVAGAAADTKPAQPVHMNNCDNGVWASTAIAVYACGSSATPVKLDPDLAGDEFAFRVNQLSVALNDLTNGYSWLVGSKTAINDWDVVPPVEQSPKDGTTKGKNVTYVEKPPTFDAHNQPPIAVDDSVGVRANGTTPLPVLQNDHDPDGDVLSVLTIGQTPSSFGSVQQGAGGQSPQFTPAANASGSQEVRYTISDGRKDGTASAIVRITIVPDTVDNPPKANLSASEIVEQGQSVTYNVLDDWADPDGDAMQLVGATVASGDDVRYTPDGYITFRSVAGTGVKTVNFTVQDSSTFGKKAQGTLTVDVQTPGTAPPQAESDYASGFAGEAITASPLLNDKSPSGQPLHLQTVKQVDGPAGGAPILNQDKGTVQISENQSGSYDFEYTETAGSDTKTVSAFIRVDVANRPDKHVAPIAVSDVAYLTYPGTVTVPVLDNDVSPEGLVLGVQSISVPPTAGLTAQLQSNTSIKITSTGTSAGNQAVKIDYTISDGTVSSTASVTVVAVPQLQTHQAPITADDLVTVRAGQVATVSVLDNDVDPDGAAMSVEQKLVQAPSAGLAFVTGNQVRFEAPGTPSQYVAVYSVLDTGNQTSTGRVIFTVLAANKKGNRAPQPEPVISRVFAGGTVRVAVPLAGTDPDGDSVLLESISQNPQLGKVTKVTSTYFDYQAAKGAAGTDVFTYQVTDSYGATAVATASIGVIPRAGLAVPTAVDDVSALRPNGYATVTVLANDSDPNGYSIALVPHSLKNLGAKPISATIDGNTVVLHAGPSEGNYSVQYTITDGHAARVKAVIHVTVSKKAVYLPPVAVDHVLQLKDVQSGKPVSVSAIDGASDPSGLISSLGVTLVGAKTTAARVSGSKLIVTPNKTSSLTIGYTLTDPTTSLTSTAFVLVPPIPPAGWNDAPILKKNLKQQVVQVSTPTKFAVSDLVTLPSNKGPARLIIAKLLTATHGTVKFNDSTGFTFSPTKGYLGSASITFDVSDAAQPVHTALLSLPVTVKDKYGTDLKPTFTTVHVDAPQNAPTPVNLANFTGNATYVTWSVTGSATGVSVSTSGTRGSQLEIKTTNDAVEGSIVPLTVTLTTPLPSNYSVTGQVLVHIVSTRAPLAQAVTDTVHIKRNGSATIDALANDVNPTPEKPLQIVSVSADNVNGGKSSTDGSTVQYTPPAGFVGNVSLHYTIKDATPNKDREVTGEILVVVWDVPDQPAAPTKVSIGDGSVSIAFNTPTSNNGSEVTNYTVRATSSSAPTPAAPACTAGATCTFTGLVNGAQYVFYVSATNAVGTSAESEGSDPIAPYRAPGNPTNVSLTSGAGIAAATLTLTWAAPAGASTTGGITYHWVLSSGEAGDTATTSVTVNGKGAGFYTFTVYAYNPGGTSSTIPSNQATVINAPTGSVYDGGNQNTNNTYRNHYLDLHYVNLAAGTYTVNLYDNTQAGIVMSASISVPGGTGNIHTGLFGYYTDANNKGWFQIEVVGQFTTPQWVPTWATPAS